MRGLASLVQVLLLLLAAVAGYEHYRLPEVIEPQHYELSVLTHLEDAAELRFEGLVRISLRILEPTKNITLHAKNLSIAQQDIRLSDKDNAYAISRVQIIDKYDYFIMHLANVVPSGEDYELSIPFSGELNSNTTGYYWSSYNDTVTNETRYLAVTQFSPTFARLAFPCFDEPALKATFQVKLGLHKSFTGISNTPLIECKLHEQLIDYNWCTYEPLLRTSTYLVGYAVHNLSSTGVQYSKNSLRTRFSSWLQPQLTKEAQFLINFAPQALSYLENLLQYDFPLRKVDQLVVPTHKFTAMENWGMTTFNQARMLHNDAEQPLQEKQSKASTVAHEYAHQWFGNLVTMHWWSDLWLKEGPSTYFAYLTLDALMPAWKFGEYTIAKQLQHFFKRDALNETRAIWREVAQPAEILEQFGDYVYEKGALTMRMLHKLLGEQQFFKGIRAYIAQNVYKSVGQAELWRIMQESSDLGVDLTEIMNSWTLQHGYPLVTVTRDYATGSVSINQTRFWLQPAEYESSNCWWIPLSFVLQSRPQFEQTQAQLWLKCPQAALLDISLPQRALPTEWLLLNPQVSSIYRVNYDANNWRLLIKALKSSANFGGIHALNRAQLMDDLFALAATNAQSYELAFSLLEYLPRERELLPWSTVLALLESLQQLLPVEQSTQFKHFMQQLLTPLLARCHKLNDAALSQLSSQQLELHRLAYAQACRYGLAACQEQTQLVSANDELMQLPVELRGVVYCSLIEQGNELQFEQLLQRFQQSSQVGQQRLWASALGCSRNHTQLLQFLDYLLQASKATTSSCYLQAVTSALRHQYAAVPATNHILQHALELDNKFSPAQIKQLLLSTIGNLHSEADKATLQQQLKGIKKFEQPLQLALETRAVHQDWLLQRSENMLQALAKYI
ncbi:CG3502 [Drosophila busckii]|uniref:Aminopeptidase n=1 Tax=Drosophila busckii TaxID=30019 RepID=A0A0M5J2J3_DROBS|nr:aminopeptidase Ey [Drosophila busckii]ALC41344.1 CG3502 [Drosophila busckii]